MTQSLRRGFTLIEVLVTLALVTFLVGSGVAVTFKNINVGKINAAQDKLIAHLRQARSAAQAGKVDRDACGASTFEGWGLTAAGDGRSYVVEGKCGVQSFGTVSETLPVGITISPAPVGVVFRPLGEGTDAVGSIVISLSGLGSTRSVSVTGTGQITSGIGPTGAATPAGPTATGVPPTVPVVATATPTPTPVNAFAEAAGQVVMEGENYMAVVNRGSDSWTSQTTVGDYSGSGYMTIGPDNDTNYLSSPYAALASELQYRVQFTTTGLYYVWIRENAPNLAGDSVHVGLDGGEVSSADKLGTNTTGSWVWTNTTMDGGAPATITITSSGLHTINVWMREDGIRLDRLMLTRSTSTPSGNGPPESPKI